ncbi:MAG: phage tail assembly chaperone [Sphingomonadales bacterium]
MKKHDWGRMAGLATGLLGWQVDDFWQATPIEFYKAWLAWAEARGLDVNQKGALNRDEFSSMISRFPD